jgi:hypothetical protein
MPRPTGFSQELADQIIDRISEGAMLNEICADENMPTRRQFRHWLTVNDALATSYARARLMWADWHAETVMSLAIDPKGNFIDENGNRLPLTHEEVGARRLHIDTVKWLVGKWAPRAYGDKPEPEPAGNSVQVSWKPSVRLIVHPMLDEHDRMLKPGSPEHDAALERALKEAQARGSRDGVRIINAEVGIDLGEPPKSKQPRQIEYHRPELPADLTPQAWSIVLELLGLIGRTIPTNSDNPPEEILAVLRDALLAHFRELTDAKSALQQDKSMT